MTAKPKKQDESRPKQPGYLFTRLDGLLAFFEKHRFNLLTVFIWIFVLSFIRMWTEAMILDYPYKVLSYDFIFYHAHIIGFFFTVFLGGVLIIRVYSKQPLLNIINLAAMGFTLSLIPPFLDILFHSGGTISYTYINPVNFVDAFTSFFLSQQGSGGFGVFIELVAILLATSIYVLIRTGSIVKTVLNFFTFYVFILLMGTPFLIFVIGENAGNLIQPLIIIRYLCISFVLLFILIGVLKKGFLRSFLKSMRLLTTGHFVLMTIIGVFIAGHLGQVGNFSMNISYLFDNTFWAIFTGNIAMFILSLFSIAFCWQYTVMINHVYDADIDSVGNKGRIIPKGLMSEKEVKELAVIFAILCVGIAFTVSFYAFVLMALGIFFGTIYSVPPIRIRDRVYGSMIIGIGSSIAFFLGFLTPGYVKVMHGANAGQIMRMFPEITTDALIIGGLIFVALTIGSLIKDYKDYEGDKQAGVKNIFTIYGLEKGVMITSVLLPVPFLCLLLLFHTLVDIIILIPLGLVAGFVFYKLRNTKVVFVIYFPVILYCLLRWFAVIQL
jgi:4-hydroxybenzoate polyprenyltransferase